jgi:vancomycin resistance protein YoaR
VIPPPPRHSAAARFAARLAAAAPLALLVCLPLPGRTQSPQPPAAAPADKALERKLSVPVLLTDGSGKVVKRTRRELGIRIDRGRTRGGSLALTADLAATKNALERAGKAFAAPAVNAKPYVYRGRVAIRPGRHARSVNVATTAQRIKDAVEKNAATTRFTVALDKKPPTLTAERLKGINGVLSSFGTRASADAKRNRNIRISVAAVDGTLLSPGETFSLNKTVGPRTQARGFRTATVFEEGEKVPGIGGGVSQVTGTLFNAAALAGLKIDEVNPHSRPVPYLPLGRDATLAWGAKDLRFTNDTGAPVYIAYAFDGRRRLKATFFGKKVPGKKIALRPRVQRLAAGKINAQLYRVVRKNGRIAQKERLLSHPYRWKPEKSTRT